MSTFYVKPFSLSDYEIKNRVFYFGFFTFELFAYLPIGICVLFLFLNLASLESINTFARKATILSYSYFMNIWTNKYVVSIMWGAENLKVCFTFPQYASDQANCKTPKYIS